MSAETASLLTLLREGESPHDLVTRQKFPSKDVLAGLLPRHCPQADIETDLTRYFQEADSCTDITKTGDIFRAYLRKNPSPSPRAQDWTDMTVCFWWGGVEPMKNVSFTVGFHDRTFVYLNYATSELINRDFVYLGLGREGLGQRVTAKIRANGFVVYPDGGASKDRSKDSTHIWNLTGDVNVLSSRLSGKSPVALLSLGISPNQRLCISFQGEYFHLVAAPFVVAWPPFLTRHTR